jgi:hypothetical protein
MDLGFTLKRPKSIRRSSLQVLKTRLSFRFTQTLPPQPRIVKQLKKERDRLHQQLSGLNAALEAFAGATGAATEDLCLHGFPAAAAAASSARCFLQGAKAASLNGREMHKYILPILTADEAIAFGVVKPLYCSFFH